MIPFINTARAMPSRGTGDAQASSSMAGNQAAIADLERVHTRSTTGGRGTSLALAPAETNMTEDEAAETQRTRRQFLTTSLSSRISAMRDNRIRESQAARQAERQRDDDLSQRFRSWRAQHLPTAMGGGARNEVIPEDVEAQAQQPQAANANAVEATGPVEASSTQERSKPAGTKSRREREEGATLFGPNLANYFGSGSSSSGAVGGVSGSSLAIANTNGVASAAAGSDPLGVSAALDPASAQSAQRRARLGSRGRARGASLSGISQWAAASENGGLQPVNKGSDPLSPEASASANELAMAEGIDLDTLQSWIERSSTGGATEVLDGPALETVGVTNAMCSTLQSYVNLKRNTMRLSANRSGAPAASVNKGQASNFHTLPSHLQTHTLQFDFDCAAPYAGVQVFVRSSRKHGSWVAWTAAREALGLSSDLTLSAPNADSLHLAQRGPPPHILGWLVHSSMIKKGFSVPLKVQLALQLDLYAPPKAGREIAQQSGQVEQSSDEAKASSNTMPAVPQPALMPETPAFNVSRQLEDPVTPAAAMRSDPLAGSGNALTTVEEVQVDAQADNLPVEETKEQRLAREKSERETLKIAIVIEALDEDGKPLREPNLQTTYLRLASMPMRRVENSSEEISGSDGQRVTHPVEETNVNDAAVVDIAVPPAEGATGDAKVDDNTTMQQRAWSVQVEGQEAEIGPHRFQLQELYGLSSRPPPPSQQTQHMQESTDADAAGGEETGDAGTSALDLGQHHYGDDGGSANECLICLSAPPTTLLLPCTHGLCLDCAVQLRDTVKSTREQERRRGRRPKRKYACPVCRRVYTNMLHLSAVDEKSLAQAAGP